MARLASYLCVLAEPKRVHRSFPDPAQATGSEDEVMAVFRAVRDDIARKVPELLAAAKPR